MWRPIQDLPRGIRAAPWLLACVLGLVPPGLQAQGSLENPSTKSASAAASHSVVSAIEALESEHDAKCHSTASRFQDFLFGTPLSTEARLADADLKKRVARQLWAEASRAAAAAGEQRVGREPLDRLSVELASVSQGNDGRVRIEFADERRVEIEGRRVEQYASIAYSLRALLAVQQDLLAEGEDALLPLSSEGIESLTQTLDLLALAALQVADREAREQNRFEIGEAQLRAAWNLLVPDSGTPAGEGTPPDSGPSLARQGASLSLLETIVEAKTAAYRAYNTGEDLDRDKLLVFNIARFYARKPLSRYRDDRRAFVSVLRTRLETFAAQLLQQANARAEAAGHRLIRAGDADTAARQMLPNRVDEFEDVHVFHHLAKNERVTLDAFDCDSLRDFGLHWDALLGAARAAPEKQRLPDPTAAEILSEAISQYAVLVLRLAGTVARPGDESIRLQPSHLTRAAARITERTRRHHAAPEPKAHSSRIASAPSEPREDDDQGFFSDVTASTGIDFVHRSSRWLGEFRHRQLKTPPTFSGGGVAAEDIDGDGDSDLLFVGGGGNALYLNDGKGHFSDVTSQASLDVLRPDGSHAEPRNPILADFDNDGRQDILITYVNDPHRLYRNRGELRFEDVSARANLGGEGLVGGPATVVDFDGDGLLDIYVAYFGNYLEGGIPTSERDNRNGLPNRLFRNLGNFRFEDVTAGSQTNDTGWTQAVSHTDFDRDGRQDLIVANDYGRNAFLRNLGDGRFENVAPALGVTKAFHSMNVGVGDLNDDEYPDIYISNLATLVKDDKYSFPDGNTPLHFDLRAMAGMLVKESDVLYLSHLQDGRLREYVPSRDVERGATSTGWAWDAEFLDFDHDGDDDLYVVNGTNDFNTFSMVYRRFQEDGGAAEYVLDHRRESNVFFRNEGGKLVNVSAASGADFASNSRSTAYFDLEGDGDLDIAVNGFHAPATILRNDTGERGGGWLKLQLTGDPERGSNRDAIGARVRVDTPDGTRRHREIQGGSGYLSSNPKQVHVGTGSFDRADVHITWPNGDQQHLEGLETNRQHAVSQAEPTPQMRTH